MIVYDVENEIESNEVDKFALKECYKNNTDTYLRAVTPARFRKMLDGSLLDAVASDSDRETDGRISVDSAANLLEVVGNKRVSVFKDEDEVFKILPAKEVVEVRMGIGNKAFFVLLVILQMWKEW
ncbi:hypothetical protein TNCV_2916761 [Trichonephila clavipes]|nr:hypothetical protein TNCV_2916761 [Trichonephila clavipes]